MTDIIIKQLNKRISNQMANSKPAGVNGNPVVSKFDEVLSSKTQNQNNTLEQLAKSISSDNLSNQPQTISADDIKINVKDAELSTAENGTFDAKKAVTNIFSTINNDSLKMDSIIEVLSSDNTKLSHRQLLAYQASIGTMTVNVEMFAKIATQFSQDFNTLWQLNL